MTYAKTKLTGSSIFSEPTLSPDTNVVRNAGFDQDLSIWEDWGGSSLLSSGAFSGSRGLRISGNDQGGMGQEILFRIKTGGVYTLTAQAKIGTASDEVYLGVRFFNLLNGTISDQRVRITTTSYSAHTVQITIPQGASSAKVYVWKQSTPASTADFDDFAMTLNAPPPRPAKEVAGDNPYGYYPHGPANASSYKLVFDEEFDTSMLDTTTWNTDLWYTTTINNELQAYRPENVLMVDSHLILEAEARSTTTTWGEAKSYASGAINTKDKFHFTMGIVEIYASLPRGAGLHSMFYLQPYNKRSPPQIDFLDALGQTPNSVSFNYKYVDIEGVLRNLTGTSTGPDYSADYHLYTVEWTETAVHYYVDGVLKGSYTGDSILRDDAFIVLSLAVGGNGVGPVGATFPETLAVQWIRVWQ
jgi:hypothetical protein